MLSEKVHKVDVSERREYFRVDDVISVVVNPVSIEKEKRKEFERTIKSSKAFSLLDMPNSNQKGIEDNPPVNPENKKLYDMITEVKTKLDFIMNHLLLEKEGLLTSEKKMVNISASGIRFTVNHPANINDILEVKLLLPTYPPIAVFAYGEVKRVKTLDDKTFEIALEYLNMGDLVKNEIIQYTLSHQRETIRKLKENGTNE